MVHRAQGNALYRVPNAAEEGHLVRTRSPILANSSRLQRVFDPSPSNEVLVYSPILAHSKGWQQLVVEPL